MFRVSDRINLQNLRVIPPECVGSYPEWNKIQKPFDAVERWSVATDKSKNLSERATTAVDVSRISAASAVSARTVAVDAQKSALCVAAIGQ